jgi:exonuclease SbcC
LVKFENSQQQIEQATLNKTQTGKLIQKYQLDLDSLENTDQRFRQELVDLESQIKSFEDLDEKIRLKEDQIEEISTKINKASSQFTAIRENKRNEEERISENKLKIAESKRWKKQYELFSQCFDWLVEYFIPTLNQIEKQVLVSILQNFNDIYKRWYSMLVEDSTKESRIDENFTPIVNQDGYEQEIGFLSGGEKTSIALAYRLTLNSLMRKESESMKSNLLILDEPTDGFSKNQLSKIRELLDELKSEQIILVSHEKELETHVDNIFNISKQDGVSKVSRL